jgi:hypothetical protein
MAYMIDKKKHIDELIDIYGPDAEVTLYMGDVEFMNEYEDYLLEEVEEGDEWRIALINDQVVTRMGTGE